MPRSERPTLQRLKTRRKAILRIAAGHGARDVRLFGSVAREKAGSRSDVDFLVRMEKVGGSLRLFQFVSRATSATLVLMLISSNAWAIRAEKMAGALSAGRSIEVAAGSALLRFDPSFPPADRASVLASAGVSLLQEFEAGWVHVGLPEGMPVGAGLNILRGLKGVVAAAPNRVFRPLRMPNDPQASSQWHFSNISANAAWEYEVGTSSLVTILIMDSGVEGAHPDLSGKIIPGKSRSFNPLTGAVSADDPLVGACEHGTEVAGVAAASSNDGIGVAGVSWGARLISLKVFADSDCKCDMTCRTDCGAFPNVCGTSEVAMRNAITYASATLSSVGLGRIVLNMSLGAENTICGADDPTLPGAVSAADAAGIVLVAAAGNNGAEVNSPGNCLKVMPVGMTDRGNNVDSRSSRDVALTRMAAGGVVAPGVGLTTTHTGGGYTASATGTSFAAPVVSGLAALILAARPDFTPAQVKDTIRNSASFIGVASAQGADAQARPLGSVAGAGMINAYRAMRLAVTGSAAFEGDEQAIAFPNPFRPAEHGAVAISVPRSMQGRSLKIKVYTMDGQFVRELTGQAWDGKNTNGLPVASGVYIFLVKTENGSQRGRVAVIR